MPDASPTKWHLAHTTWFFETVVLQPFQQDYRAFDPQFAYLFNSYYESLGPRHPRPQRGLLTRPALSNIHAYRRHVNEAVSAFVAIALEQAPAKLKNWLDLLELGIHHEQQHQELLLTDILHLFSCNPLLPAYGASPRLNGNAAKTAAPHWVQLPGGTVDIGHAELDTGSNSTCLFAFDNESPRHARLLAPYQLASNLVSCGDYLAFVRDGGYARSDWWLSDGWAAVQAQGWTTPAYWLPPGDPRCPSDIWQVFGLQGVQALDSAQPVTHISFFEAAAYAEWAGARLPTEFEWEAATNNLAINGMHGLVWQWTRSSYEPYPGFKPRSGAVREYNGKFMVGQQVLRGSSTATPPGHSRGTYRNFFHPAARWQFSGLRLAKESE
jgi:ergothioneine biosynthesis protein EgtB